MCNNELKPEIEASPQELGYRSRRYNDIQTLVRRDQRCTSCGNLVSVKSGLISFHPVLGILQCETCHGRLKGLTLTNKTSTTDNCLICGSTGTFYPCSKEDCKHKFCKRCIKRNTSLTLLAAEAGRWKCFVCSPEPLWELRAICASIMLSNKRRLKNAPTYSSHAQSRIAKTKGLTRSLRKFCDDDSSPGSSDRKKSSSLLRDSDTEEEEKDYKTSKTSRKSEPSGQKSKKVEEGKGKKSSHSSNKKASSKISESKSDETLDRATSDSDNEMFSIKSKAAEGTTSHGKGQQHQYHVDSESNSKELHISKKVSNKVTKKDTKITKCKIPISKTQGVRFKLQVVKILNRFKELCAEYELHMEHFKIQHFRKEISHMETAEEIVRKSSGLIHEVTTSLHEQEKKLNDFFRTFKEEVMQKGDSDSEETFPFEEVPFEKEAEGEEEVKHKRNKESLNKSEDKDCASSANTKKQKKTSSPSFVSTDSEGENDKKDNERKNKETDDAAGDNKQSSWKQENEKPQKTAKESIATEPDKDKDDTLEVDSEASGYDINEIFSDEEMNIQRPNNKKEPSTAKNEKEKATENKDSKSGADKEKTLKKTKLTDKTSLTEDKALIENEKEKEEDHGEKITRKGNQKAEDGSNVGREENGSDALDVSLEENDVQKDKPDEAENISEKTLSKEKNNTICNEASEASKKTKEGDLDGADDTEKDEEESLTESTLSPILKARKLAKLPTTEEINESLNDIFDCSLDNDVSNTNFTEAIDEAKEQIVSDASDENAGVQNLTEAKISGSSCTDKSKHGLSSQAKTKPTESAKNEVLKAGANKESSGKSKGHTDSEEESAKRMMLEDSESEDDINVEDVSEKSFEEDRRKISESVENTKSKEAKNKQLDRLNDKSDDDNKEEIKSSSKTKGEERRKKSEKHKAGESSTEQEEESEKQNKDAGIVVSGKSQHTEDDVASDITEILVLDDSPFEKDKDQNSFPVSLIAMKKETEKGSLEETEEKAKKDLLDSNSDDSSSDRKSRGESSKKSHKKKAGSSNSDSDSSDNEDSIQTRRLRKRKLTQRDSTGTRAKRSRTQLDVSRFNDSKLEMCCSVAIQRMSGESLEKYKKALKRSKLRLDKKAIKKLIDLERLGRDKKNETGNVTDSPGQPKNRKKKKVKETGSTLMDHLDLNKTGNDEGAGQGDDHGSDSDEDDKSVAKSKARLQTDQELMREADLANKALLLHSSDSDIDVDAAADNESEKEVEEKETSKKTKEKKKSQSDKKSTEDYEKSRWRKCKVLTGKLSDLDEEEESRQWKVKKEKLDAQDTKSKDEEENDENETQVKRRTRRTRRRIFESDSNKESSANSEDEESQKSSDGSDSSIFSKSKKKRTRKRSKSSETDSSRGEKKTKTKRRRIKKVASDSDSDTSKVPNSQENSGGKGRKNIRKVLKDKQVADDTKQAAKEEEERLKRIAERQRIYNEMYEARLAGEKKVEKLVLDFNPDTKEELVVVDENLVKKLKPHQAEGIKFMWDACFESVEQIKNTPGSGCILAHCMGLGKSLQVVGLVHTLLTHEETGVKTVLVVCPLSTVLNWLNEFQIWMKDVETGDDVNVYEMTRFKKNFERKCQLEHWHRTTGVMIISYNMFRNLTGPSKMGKKMKESIIGSLVDPGPDLVICDEGHLLKNEDTALSKCMKKIKTLRRIVLTGTPLQNNLVEYHCMVQFVKPSLLGTKREFLNRFVNPITNGQFDDSTAYDVKLMKKRAYVLHQMLKGCVQRFDYSVLMPFLPPKQEYVIFVTLTDVQIKMYKHYLENFGRNARGASSLFADFQALQRIWTHPIVLQLNAEKINERRRYSSESEDSMKDFVRDTTSESESETSSVGSNDSNDDDEVQAIHDSRNQNSDAQKNSRGDAKEDGDDETEKEDTEKEEKEWWMEYAQPEHLEDMRTSSKLVLLFGILKECEKIGDKVLVFSQSLYSLTLIEQFLERIHEQTRKGTESENLLGHSGSWSLGLDYFRLDGQTSADNRRKWCKIFNRPTNTRARLFLISTRAGGLGINLTAANRVIIFDASWNPSHDVQSIFRVYRFGQKKPSYIYRFLASGTMEEKIYNRQVTKLSLSCRVIDEQQIERHYSNHDLNELYTFEPNLSEERPTLALPKDRLLAEIFLKYKDCVENYHEHDSLLENKVEEELDEEERKMAWLEYEEEKKGKIVQPYLHMPIYQGGMVSDPFELPVASSASLQVDYENLQQLISKDYPNATPEQQRTMTNRALREMYNYWERQAMLRPANNSMMGQNAMFDNMPRQRAIMMNPQVPTAGTMPPIPQIHGIPNISANINSNVNANFVPNPFVYRNVEPNPSAVQDDDIVEVSANAAMPQAHQSNNQNKEQEE